MVYSAQGLLQGKKSTKPSIERKFGIVQFVICILGNNENNVCFVLFLILENALSKDY